MMTPMSRIKRWLSHAWVRVALIVGVVLLITVAFALVDLSPDLEHLDVRLLSGPGQGNYHALAQRLSKEATEQQGRVTNVSTQGTVDNLEQGGEPIGQILGEDAKPEYPAGACCKKPARILCRIGVGLFGDAEDVLQ